MEAIVFDDENLEVYFYQGKSDTLIITFNELETKPGNGSWGGGALRKNGFSYLGFVSKEPNWFPERSVMVARNALTHIIERFEKIVTYGHSQGGYASIRYAALFNARATISFCPQYSILPTSMGGADKRFSMYVKGAEDHREIVSTDQGENCTSFIFFDPHDHLDKLNFTHLRDKIANVRKIKMYGTGHQSVRAIANSEAIGEILRCAVAADFQGILATVRKSKRKWPARKIFLARDLALRNKKMAIRLIDSYHAPLTSDVTPGLVRNLFTSCALSYLADNAARFIPTSNPEVKLTIIRALIATDKLHLARHYAEEWSHQGTSSRAIQHLIGELDKKTQILDKKTTPFSESISFGVGWHAEESWGRWGSATRSRIYIDSTFFSGKIRSISIPISCISRSDQKIKARLLVDNHWVGARVHKGMLSITNCGKSTVIDIFVSSLHSPSSLKINNNKRIMGVRIACPSKWIINHYIGANAIARTARFAKYAIRANRMKDARTTDFIESRILAPI